MRATRFVIIMLAMGVLVACDSRLSAARRSVERFHELADTNQQAEILQMFYLQRTPITNFDQYMGRRTALLGRLEQTSEVKYEEVDAGSFPVIALHYNSTFERGAALEQFFFRVDDDGTPRLTGYAFHQGKRMECPVLGTCRLMDTPNRG